MPIEMLLLQVVDDCITGKISKGRALTKLKKQYESTLIDVKKEMHEHFER